MNEMTQTPLEQYAPRLNGIRANLYVRADEKMAVDLAAYAARLEAVNADLLAAAKAFFEWFDSVDGTTAQGVQARNQLRAIVAKVKEPNHVK